MRLVLDAERHTLARERVDDLLLDTFLTLGETLVLEEREAMDSQGIRGPTFPTAMMGDEVSRQLDWLWCVLMLSCRLCVCPCGGLNFDSCTVIVVPTPHLPTAMTESRSLFEAACKAFVQHRHDWVWVENAVAPGFGYMLRTISFQKPSVTGDPLEPVDDPAAAMPPPDHLTCHQSVVFSPTFQVPTFYFSVYDCSA